MQVKILKEEGYELALRGMAYSFKDRAVPVEEWWNLQREKAMKRSEKLAHMDGGHNKFLESLQLWIDVEACRGFWSEFDTYRVGTTKQSESTMHVLQKRKPTCEDFEEGTHPATINTFIQIWEDCKDDVTKLKMNLPEGYLQRRLISTNYKVLRNILLQRTGHRFKMWDIFCTEILAQCEHPELLGVNK